MSYFMIKRLEFVSACIMKVSQLKLNETRANYIYCKENFIFRRFVIKNKRKCILIATTSAK